MNARILQPDDLVLIFTLRGNAYLEEIVSEVKKKGIRVVSILGNQKSKLAKLSDMVLYTSSLSGEESTGMISSQIPILIIIDMLYYHYVQMYSDALMNWANTEKIFQNR